MSEVEEMIVKKIVFVFSKDSGIDPNNLKNEIEKQGFEFENTFETEIDIDLIGYKFSFKTKKMPCELTKNLFKKIHKKIRKIKNIELIHQYYLNGEVKTKIYHTFRGVKRNTEKGIIIDHIKINKKWKENFENLKNKYKKYLNDN